MNRSATSATTMKKIAYGILSQTRGRVSRSSEVGKEESSAGAGEFISKDGTTSFRFFSESLYLDD